MWIYWLLFVIPVFDILGNGRSNISLQKLMWWAVVIIFSVIIGFRDQVGGDWAHYLATFNELAVGSFTNSLKYGDVGYYGLGWVIAKLGGDIYWLNLFCALILMIGIAKFARRLPKPWLALLVAVPYLIIVVAMGYTRQSVALGFALIGLVALQDQKIVKFVIWVLVGALFHKTAVLLLPIAALASTRHRVWSFFWVAIVSVTGAALLLSSSGDQMWHNYVQANMESSGGFIRVAMNAVPAILFLAYYRRLELGEGERKLWFWIAIFSLACIPLVALASTAVDRVALYFIPIQMFVFSIILRLPKNRFARTGLTLVIIAYYAVVELVWLNYANFAKYWVPYHFMPL